MSNSEPSIKRQKVEEENSGSVNNSKPKWSGFDKNILYQFLRHPEEHVEEIVLSNEYCTVVKDAYPKARKHLLLLPNESYLDILEVRQLTPEHLVKVCNLHSIARKVAADIVGSLPYKVSFNIGYHGIPSLHPVHIHIITDDFVSPCLKNKKHWNSFTSDYFVPIDLVESWLTNGQTADSQLHTVEEFTAMMNVPLCCNHCKAAMKNIPTLKQHLADGKCRV